MKVHNCHSPYNNERRIDALRKEKQNTRIDVTSVSVTGLVPFILVKKNKISFRIYFTFILITNCHIIFIRFLIFKVL